MDTNSVRLFVLATEKLNISAAGRELCMAPAVASAKLAKLEMSLKADLLHRSTRKVSLSEEGAVFLPYAREILAQEDGAIAAMGLGDTQPTGTLRFASSSSFAQLYIAPLLPEFMERYPGIDLDLRLSDTPFDLIEGSFDLALRNNVLSDSSLRARKLADDTRILCASPEYLEKYGTPKRPEDLEQHQLIEFQGRSSRPLVDSKGRMAEFNTRKSVRRLAMDDGYSQKIATVAGAGISVNSLWNVHKEIKSGQLCRVLPDFKVEDQSALWLVYPKSNVLTSKVRVFIDFLVHRVQL